MRKILVVGLGSIGTRHCRIILDCYPEMILGILRHTSCDEQGLESLGINACFVNVTDALAFKPDFAIIANPASMHLDIAMKLARSGVHLLVEKPLSATAENVQQLIDLCEANGLLLMTAYNLRFSPALIFFRELLQGGKIGKLYSVCAEAGQYLPGWRPKFDYRKTVSAQKSLGGGVLLELSHEIDYLLWVFGAVVWVQAHVTRQSDLEIDVEDKAFIMVGFQAYAQQPPLTALVNMDFLRHDITRRCVVIGEKGTLRWDGVTGTVQYFAANGKAWEDLYTKQPERNYTYQEEIKHFIACIESGRRPKISGEDGLKTLLVIDAVRRSSTVAQRIYI